jgi:molybdopterin molybdotransferase
MSDLDVSSLLTVQQAIRILDGVSIHPRTRQVSLADADGLRLARPIKTDTDYPPFNKSQMDGGVDLKLVGEIAAGETSDHSLAAGETLAIMTGAPMPAGADSVVPIEDTERLDPNTVRILRTDNYSRFVAQRGSDCKAGQVVLAAGTRLGPAQLAVAAAVGATELEVFENPRVAVLATGDELVPANATPGRAQIRNSNTPMLLSLLRRLGCDVIDLGTAIDDPDTIRTALQKGLEFDALFVTGGMSMGEYDYVPKLLKELGVDLRITKLRIKPGKPFVFGTYSGNRGPMDREIVDGQFPAHSVRPSPPHPLAPSVFVFGLPGNPVSAFVCTIRLASRVLIRIGGGAIEEPWLTGKLDTGLPVNGPREFYQPAIRTIAPGRDSTHGEFASITPLKWTGSADLFTLARANVLLVRPENDPPLPKGTVLRVLEI